MQKALKILRAYFGEHDKTTEEHRMFTIADKAIKVDSTANKNNPDWKDKLAQDFGYKNLSDMNTDERTMIEESEKRIINKQ